MIAVQLRTDGSWIQNRRLEIRCVRWPELKGAIALSYDCGIINEDDIHTLFAFGTPNVFKKPAVENAITKECKTSALKQNHKS
jgi:hypothetical protein